MNAPERRQPQPGHTRHSTADPIIRYSSAWPSFASARPPPSARAMTRGVLPLPTIPIPAASARYAGGCLQPVLLRGHVDHIDGRTGELLHRYTTVHEPGGVLPVTCKTRRASRCPPCAEVYRADTYQLIRAGLSGGKGIPATVAQHPCVFATLTAPSFGPVHSRREKDGRILRNAGPADAAGTARTATPLACGERHSRRARCLASHCVRTATTTPARSCSTLVPPNSGGASPSPCTGRLPARPG